MKMNRAWAGVFVIALGLGCGGCAEDREESKIRDMAGMVEKIDQNKKTVLVSTYVEELKATHSFEVHITPETEILLNGALARLEDVEVGDHAEGSVKITKRGKAKHFEALQVRIKREDAIVAPGAHKPDTNGADSNGADTKAGE